MATKSERKVLETLKSSPLGWIELRNEKGVRRLYLAALGLAHRGKVRATETRVGVLFITKAKRA